MLLFGEGALVYKIFGWSFDNEDKQEIVIPDSRESFADNIVKNKATASVKNIFIDHNINQDSKKGMVIMVEYDAKDLKDEYIYLMIRFYNEDGTPLVQEKRNDKYRSINGNVIVGEYAQIPYKDCTTKTSLFIPYVELPSKGKGRTDYVLDASILHYHSNTEHDVLDRSRTYSFFIEED